LIGALLILTLSACTNQKSVDTASTTHVETEDNNNTATSTGTEQNVVPKEETSPSSQSQENTSKNEEKKAVEDAQEFLKLIKEKDADKLLQLLNKSDPTRLDIEGANKVIEGFDVNFDIDSLSVRINGDGSAMNPAIGQYEFVLADKNFKEHPEDNSLVIRYQEDGGIVYHNSYIRYFPYAEKMVVQYLDLIDKGNTIQLASFLNPDD
jgi:hypothetical protein